MIDCEIDPDMVCGCMAGGDMVGDANDTEFGGEVGADDGRGEDGASSGNVK